MSDWFRGQPYGARSDGDIIGFQHQTHASVLKTFADMKDTNAMLKRIKTLLEKDKATRQTNDQTAT